MPFLEVFDFEASTQQRQLATSKMTDALCDAYGIAGDIVSTYFVDVGHGAYGHGGFLPTKSEDHRIFVKVHAYRRSDDLRRAAARSITSAVADAYGTRPESIAVYFLDRDPGEVAHNGILASD